MQKITETVTGLALPVVSALGLALWDVEFQREGPHWVLRVVIDHADGVTTEHCEAVSRALDPLLDEADPIAQSYILEVASAGLERALKRPSDFAQFMGRLVELRFYSPQNGTKEVLGHLRAYENESIVIGTASGELRFALKDVAGVRLRLEQGAV